MDLNALSDIAQVIEAATVVGGIAFGLSQLTEMRRQRNDAVVGELTRSFMDTDFARAVILAHDLPDGVSIEQLHASGPEMQMAANRISVTFEAIGLMVYRRIAPLDLVVDLVGGIVVVMWRKFGAWIQQIRVEQSQPSFGEWFQWLAEQCQRHKKEGVPAHLARRDWKP